MVCQTQHVVCDTSRKDLGWAKGAHCVICTGQYFTQGRDDDDSDADTNSFGDAVDFDRLAVSTQSAHVPVLASESRRWWQ